jgi:SNF2 family DNA or RNA helicase
MTSKPGAQFGIDATFPDIERYIALGCLRFHQPLPVPTASTLNPSPWVELLDSDLPDEVKLILGNDVALLLDALWIRLFLHCPDVLSSSSINLVRVYLLPEDWGRRFIDRRSQKMRLKLRELLHRIDVSPQSWFGDYAEVNIQRFDPWAKAENASLFYLFNKLQSPNPTPERIKSRYARRAVEELLDSVSSLPPDGVEDQSLSGLKTKLYPYQARSASIMIQREAAPELKLDPRLEVRQSPNGQTYMFGARDGSFLHEPQFYETNRGGILAETMGLGKTIICLAVILATQGHMPQIPPAYLSPTRVRDRVGSLGDMAASILGRNAIPAQALLEQYEKYEGIELSKLKHVLERNMPHYEIPGETPRMNRNTAVPPPRPLVMCQGTIVVVPRNLLHQWQAEIRKHVHKGSLKILVMDTISKRAPKTLKVKPPQVDEEEMELKSDLPTTAELMKYDVILFTRNRFEQEFEAPTSFYERRSANLAIHICTCPYIGLSNIRDCNCRENEGYRSPLQKLHWLRIIIDEGHSFSSSMSNAVQVAKQLKAERRWVVSGTPAKNLVGVEVDLSTLSESGSCSTALREQVLERMKEFSQDDESTRAVKALGLLAAHFLMVRPWSDCTIEGKLEWDEYIYRHEHQYRKTYSGFSNCFLRTLEGLVVKTRPEDVDKDIVLPPMKHKVVYLKPCWFDKMTANLFIQVLRANAITSERTGVDYLFNKSSIKPRHSLIRNLRQSNFTWTGFSLEDIAASLDATNKYMSKEDKQCSSEDAKLLLESTTIIVELMKSPRWIALSKAHEVGIAINNWPADSEEFFGMAYPEKPTMVGITQLLDGQSHVDRQILSQNPADGLDVVGQTTKAKLAALAETENESKGAKGKTPAEPQLLKVGVPSSCVGGQPLTSRRTSTITANVSPPKNPTATPKKPVETPKDSERVELPPFSVAVPSPTRSKKRKLTAESEKAALPDASPLRDTRIIGTTSAKLTYLIEMVIKHQADEKIIIFYDGDNAAFYIAQCLEFLHVNHRIYARTLDNTKRSEYVALFNEDSDIRVLLIDVACGALGLNLNAASVVLIVNPINRPGIEAQAIKRAHRIGQTKEVLVETLVLEGTIEEAIFKQAKKMSRYVF